MEDRSLFPDAAALIIARAVGHDDRHGRGHVLGSPLRVLTVTLMPKNRGLTSAR